MTITDSIADSSITRQLRERGGPEPVLSRSGAPRVIRESAYAIAALPIGIAAFVIAVTMLALGGGLLITFVGLPILALTAYVARGFAFGERRMITALMDVAAPSPRYLVAGSDSWLTRIFTPIRDPQTWLDLVHALIRMPLGIISFTLTVTWWSMAIGGLTWPLWGWALPDGPNNSDLPELIGLGDSYPIRLIFHLAIGVFALVTLPWVVRGGAWLNAGPALLLLSGRAEMQGEIDRVHVSRVAARDAQATELRRLERDIHDGPQQRLVRLSMDLGRIRSQLERDPELARATLDGAIGQTRDTLDELRALSRGIAPPILVDRGLQAALEEIATRQQVPVYLELLIPQSLPSHVETTTYFMVSEALTNIAKHSDATLALVEIDGGYVGEPLRVRITDDGRGGASIAKGHGLGGLDDRVRSVDGELTISSPVGGPTMLEATLPCA